MLESAEMYPSYIDGEKEIRDINKTATEKTASFMDAVFYAEKEKEKERRASFFLFGVRESESRALR